MKKFLALFLALLCVFCFVGCDNSENDYKKITQYLADYGGTIIIEDDIYGSIIITDSGNVTHIQCAHLINVIGDDNTFINTSIALKLNEDSFNYEGSFRNRYYSSCLIKGRIPASTHNYSTILTYHYSTGTLSPDSEILSAINETMINSLYVAQVDILRETGVDIYELFGFDALV